MGILENIRKIQEQIAKAAHLCGRDIRDITLVAISKYATIDEIKTAYNAGLRHFGESRVQDALLKMEQCPSDIQWHLIGSLQSNKVAKAAGRFSLIHSVDTLKLAEEISSKNVPQKILLQVNTSQEKTKRGFSKEECKRVFEKILALDGLEVKGLMTMAPLTQDQEKITQCFRDLRLLRDELRNIAADEKILSELSMGMSQDFFMAIQEGATLLRIGSAIFDSN